MKKRFWCLTVVVALIFSFVLAIPAFAQQVTAKGTGYTNIEFSNGYFGYCIDRSLHGAESNDIFNVTGTDVAKSNVDNTDISQYLKLFFVLYFEDLFVSDGNGGYVLDSNKKDSSVPSVVYHFSEGQYVWGESKTYANGVKAYTGAPIPDDGHSITISNGDVITFSFIALEPTNDGQQTFFAYKVAVNQQPAHTHDFSDDWEFDDDKHWHECDCGEKSDEALHDGNEPDCSNPSICDDCGKELEGVDPDNHSDTLEIRDAKPAEEFVEGYTGDKFCVDCGELVEKGTPIPPTHVHDPDDSTWKSNDDKHWHECDCGEHDNEESHTFEDGKCIICQREEPNINPNPTPNPDGGTIGGTNGNTNGGTNTGTNSDATKEPIPNTSSDFNLALVIALIISAGGISLTVCRRRKSFVK